MVTFEWVVALLAGAVILSALARRIGAPYPALLAIGGALLALSITRMRADGEIGDDAFHVVEEHLDRFELTVDDR
jgi:hypothetical protein